MYVLFLAPDGTVKHEQKISALAGDFDVPLDDGDRFGEALASLGDLDGDGRVEIAVGASGDDDGALDAGAVWVLSLGGKATAHWNFVTPGKPGSHGVPLLRAEGPIVATERSLVELRYGAADAATWMVVGLGDVHAPYKGGVLIAEPDALAAFVLDSAGALTLPVIWPAGLPPQVSFWLQAWIVDPAATYDLSASNGLRGLTH